MSASKYKKKFQILAKINILKNSTKKNRNLLVNHKVSNVCNKKLSYREKKNCLVSSGCTFLYFFILF